MADYWRLWFNLLLNMPFLIFQLIVLIFSVMVHEIAHGAVALALGDETAKRAGRLTLNPLKHLDPFGSVILPLLLALPAFFGGSAVIIGWAKPVPYDPRYLKNPKLGAALIAGAGPLTNLILAAVFGGLMRLVPVLGLPPAMTELLGVIVLINIVLAVFNLVPIPPLDGSKILAMLLPARYYHFYYLLEIYGFIILLFFIFFFFPLLYPVIDWLFELLT